MTILDDVKTFVMSFKKVTWTDKNKAEYIKNYILNLEDVSDNTKKNILVLIKPFAIENNIFKDPASVVLINSTELYDKCIKQTIKNREDAEVLNIDMNIIEKLLKLKDDKEINRDTGEYQINKYSLLSYLLFTSGMRTNEIIYNSFEIINYNTAKATRISKKADDGGKNIINLLINSSEWLDLFNQLQSQIKDSSKNSPSTIGMGIKRKLLTIHPDLHAHSLRKLYLAYHLQIKKTGANKMPSINTKNLLNHSNENASVFYNGAIKITGELADIINNADNTDYSKLKVRELQQLLTEREIYWHPKMRKAQLINNLTD